MKVWQRNLLIGVGVVVVLVGGFFGVCAIINANKTDGETVVEVSTVDRETVEMLVAKFNAQVMDKTQWELMPANDETLVTYEGNFWYPLAEGVSLVVVPEEFTGKTSDDIVKVALIYSNKDDSNRPLAEEYWHYLAQANNLELSEEEVTTLLEDAERLKSEENVTDVVKGVSAAIFENDDHFEFQVLRNY